MLYIKNFIILIPPTMVFHINYFLEPRASLPPLLLKLSERRPESLDYIGVSFGVTEPLLKFWKRAGFVPVYLRLALFFINIIISHIK